MNMPPDCEGDDWSNQLSTVFVYDVEAGKKVFYDNQLPHRGFDGHIRVSSYEGESTSKAAPYANARNSTLENLLPLFDLSPETVIFGGWDSTRSKNQLRIPSILVGETYAVLAEQNEDPAIHRAGGRVDPVGASINVDSKNDRVKIVGDSVDLSDKTKASFEKTGKGSTIGLGAIPPSAKKDLLDGVSVRKVISTRVVSFATVRTFHFGKGAEGDAAIRALIIAVLLRDIAGYDANPFIRANCFLSETGKPTVVLNKRYGEKEELQKNSAGYKLTAIQSASNEANATRRTTMSVEISAENRQEYQAWTPVEEDLEGLPKNIYDVILQMRVDCSTTDRNRMPYYGAVDDIDEFTDIPYIDDGTRAHQLDIYIPHDAIMCAARNLPVYIDVHGGGFVYGYKELNRNFCIALARRGFAVISISYRVYPQADFLGQLQDVNAAISWLQNHADEYPIDPNRMGITGDSAGGCLSLYTLAIQSDPELLDREKLGFKQTNLKFGALVSGKFDLSEYVDDTPIADDNEPDLLRTLAKPLFGRFIDAAECSKIYSLRNLTGKLPPLFLTTSSDDFIQYESLALADALARNHVDFELHDIRPAKGEALGHIFPVGLPWLEESEYVLDRLKTFTYEVM